MSGWPSRRPETHCRGGCGRKAVYTTKELCRRCYRRDKTGLDINFPVQVRRPGSMVIERRYIDGEMCKHCPACNLWVSLGQFTTTPRAVDGLYTYCKLCAAARRHGITRETLLNLFEAQAYRCGVCGTDVSVEYVIDHDHTCCTGKLSCGQCVRGILCTWCNVSLGRFEDSVEGLLKAVRYLQSREGCLS